MFYEAIETELKVAFSRSAAPKWLNLRFSPNKKFPESNWYRYHQYLRNLMQSYFLLLVFYKKNFLYIFDV